MTEQPTTAADPRDAMTVQQIARNIVDEFPTFHERRQLLINEIAGALGHERQRAEARLQDGSALRTVQALAEALHEARVGCSGDVCDPTPALYVGVSKTMHETDARDILAALAALPPSARTCPVCEGWGAYCPEHKP